ncbi:MAG: hemerythrin domain-containing protein [Halothermotrichaceae bacterium]
MNSIELMMEEHRQIKKVLKIIRKLALRILDEDIVEVEAFYDIIDFVRNYADKHHHSKEEDVLFNKMENEFEEDIMTPINAMINEHELGRMFMQKLELSLKDYKQGLNNVRVDIIANSVAYADMLIHHIDKEDKAIYVYGKMNLSEMSKDYIEKMVKKLEQEAEKEGIQHKYMKLIEKLDNKVNN